MPMYDYICTTCGISYEAIVSARDRDRGAPCPTCGSEATQRSALSLFAVGSGGTSAGGAAAALPPGCGSCPDPRGPGACGFDPSQN